MAPSELWTPGGYCPGCGYRMDPGVCPECGQTVTPQTLCDAWPPSWRRGYWKSTLSSVAFCLLIIVGMYSCYLNVGFGLGGNAGLSFGYYAMLNQVKQKLRESPNVRIVREHLHRDLTLEDFRLILLVDDAVTTEIAYHDYSGMTCELYRPLDRLHINMNRSSLALTMRSSGLSGRRSEMRATCLRIWWRFTVWWNHQELRGSLRSLPLTMAPTSIFRTASCAYRGSAVPRSSRLSLPACHCS